MSRYDEYDDQTSPPVSLGVPRLVAGMLTAGVFVYGGYVLWVNQMSLEGQEDPMWPYLAPIFAGTAVLFRKLAWPAMMRRSARRRLALASSDEARQKTIKGMFQAEIFGGLSMYEGAAFLAFTWYELNSDVISLVTGVVVGLLMPLDFPRQSQYDRWERRLRDE